MNASWRSVAILAESREIVVRPAAAWTLSRGMPVRSDPTRRSASTSAAGSPDSGLGERRRPAASGRRPRAGRRRGLPFENVASIYAEHFLEHLALQEGMAFLVGCRRVLAPAGILRISTPNLDWVMRPTTGTATGPRTTRRSWTACRSTARFTAGATSSSTTDRPSPARSRCGLFEDHVPSLRRKRRAGARGARTAREIGRHPRLPHVIIAQASGRAGRVPMSRELLEEYRQALEAK